MQACFITGILITNKNINTDCPLNSFRTSQTYYQKILKHLQQSINNRPWRPPGLSSGPLCAPKHPQRVPRDPQETLKIHQRGSKRVPRGSKRVPRRTLGRSWGLFRSLLGSLLDALGLTFTQKDDYHDFWHAKISMFDACASDFGPKSACSMPVHRILVQNAQFLWKSHRLRRLWSGFRSTFHEKGP